VFAQLPAGLAAATTAAAASTAATTFASAAAAATVSAAAAFASTAAATESAAFRARTRFVDNQITAAQIRAVKGSDGLFGLAGVGHLHEGKASRAARVPVGYQVHGSYFAMHFEGASNLVFCG
jgi:hypothetical protein